MDERRAAFITLHTTRTQEPTMTPNQLQLHHLTKLTTKAGAALIPLAADGEGSDSHGGNIQHPDLVVRNACEALVEAAELAAQLLARPTP